jgi:deoxyribodipyrimidine photo-lyase
LPGTSLLSPYLASGNICIHEVWRRLQSSLRGNAAPFLRQLAWRDFNMHLMAGFGDLWRKPLRPEFEALPYRKSARDLRAWQRGETGYPIVDAGMRQLWATGWMHNRVRMIAASFLVKHLLIDWREGEAWFWDTLVDADPSQNPGNWQWVAGCGADAAPYFRIFNPILQGRRFDPDGTYIRKWVPELSNLPAKFIHAPFAAPLLDLAAAGIQLGRDYCAPIVDHKIARDRALAASAGISARTRL